MIDKLTKGIPTNNSGNNPLGYKACTRQIQAVK